MADVLDLTHPKPRDDAQSALFGWLLDRRHDRPDATVPAQLATVRANAELQAMAEVERRLLLTEPDAARRLAAAGMSWEALSGWLNGPMDATAWEAVIRSMGYMALLRAGVLAALVDVAGGGGRGVRCGDSQARQRGRPARVRRRRVRAPGGTGRLGAGRGRPVHEPGR